jgi:predicted PhzF superfamily epimerase YddE/YHI9
MAQRIITVDAFADRPFAGNPAAVCLLDAAADERWMRDVAREMNLSETAFLHPEPGGVYRLRWFTPAVEVDLCGHATLASAHVLWEDGHLDPAAPARFLTRSGPLSATRRGDAIELDFPARPPGPCAVPPGLPEALGAEVEWAGLNGMDCLVALGGDAVVRGLAPDVARLAAVPVRGVIVTAPSADPAFDFVSRFFAPNAGVAEDPVTGSAHCALGPYWGGRLGKAELVGYQASARGGVVGVGLRGDRVALRGKAVTVVRGELVAG